MAKNKLIVSAVSLSAVSGLILAGSSLVSASTTQATSPNRISRYVIVSDRKDAQASVLGLTRAQLIDRLKTTTLKQLVANKGLTQDEFMSQVKATVATVLANQGYTSAQITKFQNKTHHHNSKKTN